MRDSEGKPEKEVKQLWELVPEDVKRLIDFIENMKELKEEFIRKGVNPYSRVEPIKKAKTKKLRLLKK